MSCCVDRRATRRAFVLTLSAGWLSTVAGCGGSSEPEEMLVFREAMTAVAAGDKVKGMELLNKCLEIKPSHYAYYERARLHMEAKEIPEAIADCKQGLELDPENKDLKWLLAELEKPEPKRFQGPAAFPPASRK